MVTVRILRCYRFRTDGVMLRLADGLLRLSDGLLRLSDGLLRLADGLLRLSDGGQRCEVNKRKFSHGILSWQRRI